MKISKQLLAVAGITPKLRLGNKTEKGVKPTGAHKVRILEDKIIKGMDGKTGKEIEYVEYILEENGEKKNYKTKLKDSNGKLSYLVQRLAEINEGDEVILEMKKQGIKNYIEVTPVSGSHTVEADEEESEDEGYETIN